MRRNSLPAIVLSVVCILACGLVGALTGALLVRWMGLEGIPAALIAVLVGMLVAAATFTVGAILLRRLGGLR